MQYQQSGTPVNLSATGAVSLCPGSILGFYVNSTAGGTLVFRDGGSAGTAITGTITPVIGWHEFPAAITTSAHVTIAVAGLNITVMFAAG